MLGKALRIVRVFHNYTQAEIARKIGVTQSYISEIEKGDKTPSLDIVQAYAKQFKIPASSIMFLAENLGDAEGGRSFKTALSKKVVSILEFIAEGTGDEPKQRKKL